MVSESLKIELKKILYEEFGKDLDMTEVGLIAEPWVEYFDTLAQAGTNNSHLSDQ